MKYGLKNKIKPYIKNAPNIRHKKPIIIDPILTENKEEYPILQTPYYIIWGLKVSIWGVFVSRVMKFFVSMLALSRDRKSERGVSSQLCTKYVLLIIQSGFEIVWKPTSLSISNGNTSATNSP